MTKSKVLTFIACVLLTASILVITSSRPAPQAASAKKVRCAVEQSRFEAIKRHNLDLNNLRALVSDGEHQPTNFDQSIFTERRSPQPSHRYSSSATPPAPSPGTAIAVTVYDYQDNHSAHRRVARIPGADIVHFTWMGWEIVDPFGEYFDRFVYYNSYSISGGSLNQGFGGVRVDLGINAHAGYPEGDVLDDNTFQMALHQRASSGAVYQPYHLSFPTPGSASRLTQPLSGFGSEGCEELLWPSSATSRDGDRTVHVLAHTHTFDCPTDLLWYWRFDGAAWTGPVIVDSTPHQSYVVADDPTGEKVAVAVHVDNYASMNGINNVAYLESVTDGAGWIAGTEPIVKNVITNYSVVSGPGAWLHLSACYDNAGVLHIAYDEQRIENLTSDVAIKHWNSQRQTVRTVALGYWDSPYVTGIFNLNLAKLTMGIGDGSTMCQGGAESNEDYVYILYTQFGGPTPEEQADHSLNGYYNGELYLAVSASGGNSWSVPVNLTNTKTPDCDPGPADSLTMQPSNPDGVCRSEHWASIGLAISDIDILFISDLDPGGFSQYEGSAQLNPVHYMRIPGGTTDATHICPLINANFESSLTTDTDCERNTGQNGTVLETLTLMNLGNGLLNGTITVTDFPGAPTLSVSGGAAYSIIAGDPDDSRTVTMSANGAAEGLYQGLISITHNDPNKPSPRDYPIDLFVFNEFFCPQFAAMQTGVASPGSLQLLVSNDGRFGNGDPQMGLWRFIDSSSSIDAGTLLIAHGLQGTDTTVYLRYGTRASNGQAGLRAIGDLIVNTDAYGTGTGCAYASASLATADSVVGVTIEWGFPQDPSLDEFIVARYKFYRHNPMIPITNLAIGILADLDILPATRLDNIQRGVTNGPGSDGNRNLIWAQGKDTVGHVAVGQNTATRFRGGMMFPGGYEGMIVGNAVSDIQPGGGPSDGFLYSSLHFLAGIDLYSVADTDLYAMVALDKGRSLAVGETLSYTMILLSDTVSEASLKSTADLALANLATLCPGPGDVCPCWADPECDGVRSDVLDVVKTVNVAFRGALPSLDPNCPKTRSDVNSDDATDVSDVVRVINVAFRGGTVAANYVDPWGGM